MYQQSMKTNHDDSHSNIVEREIKESVVTGNHRVGIEDVQQFFKRDVKMRYSFRTTEKEK